MIVKYVETLHNGIRTQVLSRYAIGYILRGTKSIYDGDKPDTFARRRVLPGHRTPLHRELPEGEASRSSRCSLLTPADLQRILMHLNITYGLEHFERNVRAKNCRNRSQVAMPAWNAAAQPFSSTRTTICATRTSATTKTAENIKMTELIYLLASHEDCCIKEQAAQQRRFRQGELRTDRLRPYLRGHLDRGALKAHQPFADIVQERIPPPFPDAASQVVHPAAAHALASAAHLDVEIHLEIGNECTFPNTSHFIKLFKKEYQMTPATYRHRHVSALTSGSSRRCGRLRRPWKCARPFNQNL